MNALQRLDEKKRKHGKEALTDLEWYLLLDGKASESCREHAAAELERLQRIEQAAKNLQTRLDNNYHGGGPLNDWKEQAELRAALIDTQNQT